jgi:hypothetical protein
MENCSHPLLFNSLSNYLQIIITINYFTESFNALSAVYLGTLFAVILIGLLLGGSPPHRWCSDASSAQNFSLSDWCSAPRSMRMQPGTNSLLRHAQNLASHLRV